MDLGKHYIALAVKDIEVSKTFYEQLGFVHAPGFGSIEDKWLIMISGGSKIGLYQDMFPKNTLTFNPPNVRGIQKVLKNSGVEIKIQADENTTGPAYIMLIDPDGNPVLLDQYE